MKISVSFESPVKMKFEDYGREYIITNTENVPAEYQDIDVVVKEIRIKSNEIDHYSRMEVKTQLKNVAALLKNLEAVLTEKKINNLSIYSLVNHDDFYYQGYWVLFIINDEVYIAKEDQLLKAEMYHNTSREIIRKNETFLGGETIIIIENGDMLHKYYYDHKLNFKVYHGIRSHYYNGRNLVLIVMEKEVLMFKQGQLQTVDWLTPEEAYELISSQT